MIAARVVGIVIALGGCAGLWFGWENLSILRGTVLQDLRFVAFAVAAFLFLSIAEWLAARLSRLFGAIG